MRYFSILLQVAQLVVILYMVALVREFDHKPKILLPDTARPVAEYWYMLGYNDASDACARTEKANTK